MWHPGVALWEGVYLALVLVPLFALLIEPRPQGLGLRWDVSMALGLAGLAMMVVQFVLTARFRRPPAPFGIDLIYYFHRYVGVVTLAVIVGRHPASGYVFIAGGIGIGADAEHAEGHG